MTFLRVNIKGFGYIGLVDVAAPQKTTLKDLRLILAQTFDVDMLPPNYLFLTSAPSGSQQTTVGMRREALILAASLAPTISLLPVI